MATKKGLEPSTFAVTGRRSNQLSYLAKNVLYQTHGRGGGTRTPDPMLPKHVRYQLRYTPKRYNRRYFILNFPICQLFFKKKLIFYKDFLFLSTKQKINLTPLVLFYNLFFLGYNNYYCQGEKNERFNQNAISKIDSNHRS